MLDYKLQNIQVFLKTIPNSYDNHKPVDMSAYEVLYEKYADRDVFDVWESSVEKGQGWIGIVCNDSQDSDLTITGEYTTVIHEGSYSQLQEVYQQIMVDHPQATEFYSIYLNDPKTTQAEQCLTKIVFK